MSLILPKNDMAKPQNVSRRGFLRFLGITATIATVPSLIVPKKQYIITNKPMIFIGTANGPMQFLGYAQDGIRLSNPIPFQRDIFIEATLKGENLPEDWLKS